MEEALGNRVEMMELVEAEQDIVALLVQQRKRARNSWPQTGVERATGP
jgi:hypothetical protein